jgi:hypothetical protein
MVRLSCYDPDGSPKVGPDGKPLEYIREEEHRAVLSAQKAWWPVGAIALHDTDPSTREPPEGAEIRRNGAPFLRAERIPLYAADGIEILDTKMAWVDIAEQARNAKKAALIASVKARIDAQRAARSAEVEVVHSDGYRDTVSDPIAVVGDGHPLDRPVVDVKSIEAIEPVAPAKASKAK